MHPTDAKPPGGRETIPPRERESNLGAAARLGILLPVAGAILLLATVLLLAPPVARAPAFRPAPAERSESPPPGASAAPAPVPAQRLEAEGPDGEPALPPPGKGRLRVFLVDPPEGPRKGDCLVAIGPTALLLAPGKAVEKTAIVPLGSDRCAFEDLPDAGYLVRASGEGLSAVSAPVEVGPACRVVTINLALRRTVFVDGAVLDEEATPLEGVLVRLEEERPGGARLEAASDPSGRYRIDGVSSGLYRLFVGPRESPLLEPVRVALENAPLRHDVRLPVFGSLEVTVVDEAGLPLPARLDGFGPPGGTFHGEVSPEGTFLARNLPAGDYRVSARARGSEQRYAEAKVVAREKAALRVVLRPAR
ncbi:MAG TPA: carboxypeptidase-like regulatory domain-containing protein [Planctomycetota bacterium]|jgi:hypothetical protein|nr:carboxypeptidase-like regulatory domain-containing protein [Planctomycetota bacterium]